MFVHHNPPLTVLPWSEEAVVWGRLTKEAPIAVHIFGLVGSGKKKKLQKLREVNASCEHEYVGHCGVVVKGKKLLAVACAECSNVACIDVVNGAKRVAYQGGDTKSEFRPDELCVG